MSISNKINNKIRNERRHAFLLETFFVGEEGFAIKDVGRFTLVKQFDANNQKWEVAIWEAEAYKKTKDFYFNHIKGQPKLL